MVSSHRNWPWKPGAGLLALFIALGALPIARRGLAEPVVRPGAVGREAAQDAEPRSGNPESTPTSEVEELHLVVLHTNDLHGQVLPRAATWIDPADPPLVGGLPRVAAAIAKLKREQTGPTTGVLALDGGDWFQGTPEGSLGRGLGFVTALARVDYDALVLGNHDFDHGLDHLTHMLEVARPRAVCANLIDPKTGREVGWVDPWRIVEVAGLRVALVGLLTPETPTISHADTRTRLAFMEPVEALGFARARLGLLADPVDLVIPVTHIGVEEDEALARAFPDLPLIVGGHSHTFLPEGLRVGETLIVQAGSRATSVGRVDLILDAASHDVLRSSARSIELRSAPPGSMRIASVEEACADLARRSAAHMSEVVGELRAPATRANGWTSSSLGSWICDAMLRRTGADVAFHNRGGTRADIEAGPVTRRAIFEVLPFDNELVTMTLLGSELEGIVRETLTTRRRGLDWAGLEVDLSQVDGDPEEGGGAVELLGVRVAGVALDPEAEYRVTTNSFLADGGDGYLADGVGTERERDMTVLRKMLELDLQDLSPFRAPEDDRYSVRR